MSRYNEFTKRLARRRCMWTAGENKAAKGGTGRLMKRTTALMIIVLLQKCFPAAIAFTARHLSHNPHMVSSSATSRITPSHPHAPNTQIIPPSATALFAMNKRNKFNKQKDLAAKMAEAKRQRESAEDGGDTAETTQQTTIDAAPEELSAAEIKLRNDRQRFADMLDNSIGSGGDLDKGYYQTEAQEMENADAVHRGVDRLYEGDPAPSSPFEELLDSQTGEPVGKGGMKRLVPWEGSRSVTSEEYLVVVTDPRPKSTELRTAIKLLAGSLSSEVLKKCMVINTDTPAENRRFAKRSFGDEVDFRILTDENMGWLREYTALGEKRFSITMFVLRNGRVEKLAREVEAEVLPMVVKNAIRSLN